MDKVIYEEEILELALDLGEIMLSCGAEIRRVEDSITRICNAYQLENVKVFAITSLIIASAKCNDGRVATQIRRVKIYGTNLSKIEDANALSRYICKNKISTDEIKKELLKIKSPKKQNKHIQWDLCIGYLCAAGGFTVFFGGNGWDAVASCIIAFLMFLFDTFIKKPDVNRIVYTVFVSIVMGIIAILFVKIGIGVHVDKIMIGDIMLLIPALVLVNSLRAIFLGDTIAGMIQLTEAILIALSIAGGFAIALVTLGGIL
ncbi:threonine/serine exporter family protein [Clostridium algidicarnis]|uniref:threonine/serine exporter family protein n=1 Tax=Clostridium algidicarnis TaxID=37659 RepID=UPI00049538E9|nr:threonine/serine exporter family protein [Clostridium algidicarnis]MBB6630735.1 threonine/serine exporter family protein [Clostridium algidicarnis]MBU3205896.1 threonine/serine exporter family protein [Clostridium algidicarnis]MBU3228733.1 threonine/serine exporter family protein [Clostridium algidicarnis]MBU3252277.1 threonine/serine exporter family protein [Clostridium algidicarnis]